MKFLMNILLFIVILTNVMAQQVAVKPFGKGRIAVFGEAAMFTAQRSGSGWFGLKSPGAEQAQQFLLNIMHWFSGMI